MTGVLGVAALGFVYEYVRFAGKMRSGREVLLHPFSILMH